MSRPGFWCSAPYLASLPWALALSLAVEAQSPSAGLPEAPAEVEVREASFAAATDLPREQAAPAMARVVDIVSDIPGSPNAAGLGDRFTVTVEHLPAVLAEAGGCQSMVLFLGGMPIPDASPERCDPDNGHVGFFLQRTGDSNRVWSALLGSPTSFRIPVRVTVGSSPTRSYPTLIEPGRKTFYLIVIRRSELVTFLVIFFASLSGVGWLARRTALLRKPGTRPYSERPFSISRLQLAFWSILAAEAYLFVWLLSGNLDSLTESVLVLMGMGSATALGASMIESDSKGEAREPRTSSTSKGFLYDILSDSSGICIQRFQMFSWTLILGVIFCTSVYDTLQMPEFSGNLLALMGISSGTYLAFKFPEKQKAQADDRAAMP